MLALLIALLGLLLRFCAALIVYLVVSWFLRSHCDFKRAHFSTVLSVLCAAAVFLCF